jgi:hypothetical protein
MPIYRPMTLHICFYLKLPQTTVAMVNGNYVAYNLTIWHGTADLSTLTSEEVDNPCQNFKTWLQADMHVYLRMAISLLELSRELSFGLFF